MKEYVQNTTAFHKRIQVIDLFCGAGGLTHGLKMAGLNVVAGIDIEEKCRFAYESNNNAKFIKKDVSEITKQDVKFLFNNATFTVLAGCAPCQPFSNYTGKIKGTHRNWPLLYQFKRLVEETFPDIVTMENVPNIVKHSVYKEFHDYLANKGYHVWSKKINCVEYGIPQNRKRLVLLASKFGPISLIQGEYEKVTVRNAIGHLPPIKDGETNSKDALHRSSKLNAINYKRISTSLPNGTWKDWPEELRAQCHIRESGKTYTGVYGRMSWDSPSPTITTLFCGFGNGRFGHPEQNRAISLREASLLQTFPSYYMFFKEGYPISLKAVSKMIGNAVPVKLGLAIGKSILEHLSS